MLGAIEHLASTPRSGPSDSRYFHFGCHLSVNLQGHHLTGPHVLLKWEKLQSEVLAFIEKIYWCVRCRCFMLKPETNIVANQLTVLPSAPPPPSQRKGSILCPPSPRRLPRSCQHGGQSTAGRPAVGSIRRIGADRKPRRKRLLHVRIQDLPAERRPRGYQFLLHQRERLQRGTNWCPRCNGR